MKAYRRIARAGLSPPSWDQRQKLTFQLDLDDLERYLARVLRKMGEGVHVHDAAGLRRDVLRPSVRVGELRIGVG